MARDKYNAQPAVVGAMATLEANSEFRPVNSFAVDIARSGLATIENLRASMSPRS